MFAYIKNLYYFSWLSVFVQWFSRYFALFPYLHSFKKLSVEFVGEKPDPKQNYIVISNHRSYFDPPLLGYAIGMPTAFVAKKELFTNPFLYLYMVLTSTISVDREKPESQTFKYAKQALNSFGVYKSWCLGIFIEGTRSKEPGKLGKANKGPMFIARLTKKPIIPMGISYRGKRDIVIKIGEPY
ncbi:MAG: lysophospholipid acyltransferase family protein, partial [Candidatus Melainabacteria bacterium]|nr:lysophospholipid acyltransferase family protein [Candidatus Melainabacteria bacterium]